MWMTPLLSSSDLALQYPQPPHCCWTSLSDLEKSAPFVQQDAAFSAASLAGILCRAHLPDGLQWLLGEGMLGSPLPWWLCHKCALLGACLRFVCCCSGGSVVGVEMTHPILILFSSTLAVVFGVELYTELALMSFLYPWRTDRLSHKSRTLDITGCQLCQLWFSKPVALADQQHSTVVPGNWVSAPSVLCFTSRAPERWNFNRCMIYLSLNLNQVCSTGSYVSELITQSHRNHKLPFDIMALVFILRSVIRFLIYNICIH